MLSMKTIFLTLFAMRLAVAALLLPACGEQPITGMTQADAVDSQPLIFEPSPLVSFQFVQDQANAVLEGWSGSIREDYHRWLTDKTVWSGQGKVAQDGPLQIDSSVKVVSVSTSDFVAGAITTVQIPLTIKHERWIPGKYGIVDEKLVMGERWVTVREERFIYRASFSSAIGCQIGRDGRWTCHADQGFQRVAVGELGVPKVARFPIEAMTASLPHFDRTAPESKHADGWADWLECQQYTDRGFYRMCRLAERQVRVARSLQRNHLGANGERVDVLPTMVSAMHCPILEGFDPDLVFDVDWSDQQECWSGHARNPYVAMLVGGTKVGYLRPGRSEHRVKLRMEGGERLWSAGEATSSNGVTLALTGDFSLRDEMGTPDSPGNRFSNAIPVACRLQLGNFRLQHSPSRILPHLENLYARAESTMSALNAARLLHLYYVGEEESVIQMIRRFSRSVAFHSRSGSQLRSSQLEDLSSDAKTNIGLMVEAALDETRLAATDIVQSAQPGDRGWQWFISHRRALDNSLLSVYQGEPDDALFGDGHPRRAEGRLNTQAFMQRKLEIEDLYREGLALGMLHSDPEKLQDVVARFAAMGASL